jgi:hypothetical protein
MLDRLPIEVWNNSTLKFVDPSCKSGIFLSEVVIRLMKGLEQWEPDELKRHEHIIKNMVFGYAYTRLGYKITKKLLYGDSSYDCDNIKLKLFSDETDLTVKFNVIVGNPPYNKPPKVDGENPNRGSLWPAFVEKSINLLKDGGYLCMVHPSKWRRPADKLWPIITANQIHYLSIHNLSDGQKTFDCETRYDWYVLQKISPCQKTIIRDEQGIINAFDLRNHNWIPNFFVDNFEKLFAKCADEKCKVLRTTNYRTDKPWISRIKGGQFVYPVVLGVDGGKHTFCYASKKISDFGESKVVCVGTSGECGVYPINDFNGEYGINGNSFGIPITSKQEGDDIVKALSSKKFNNFLKSILWTGYWVNYKAFEYLKKDFWKEFI